jgi:glyoxylase-like metal-dependent hydrolase (beta-lactamase superfamily II)
VYRRLEFRPGPNERDWEYQVAGLTVSSVHLPGHNNHGVTFELDGVRYGFTGDATEVNARLQRFCREAQVCVFDFGHLSNRPLGEGRYESNLDRVVELLGGCGSTRMVASHIYLRHWQDRLITAEQRYSESVRLVREAQIAATAAGFLGTLELAEEFILKTAVKG